ncbi:hypothetical protein HHK36_028098 [Tetracentron sinense]|uniref:U6 snRNA phosphodiesterase 1 n=1 Tax=Tetracentron sinense TaxID=13715 RepID=A0A834YKE9_TETSI|nr:hypothetical protein HHK36_028098 [Tetracentron sinense]
MEALRASYGGCSSDSEPDSDSPPPNPIDTNSSPQGPDRLPPPPLALLEPPNSLGIHIPSTTRKWLVQFLKKITSLVPGLHVVDVDISLDVLCKDELKLEQVALGREFHISLGRTVPIRVHQIDSVVTMLRQKLQAQRRPVNRGFPFSAKLKSVNRGFLFGITDHILQNLSIAMRGYHDSFTARCENELDDETPTCGCARFHDYHSNQTPTGFSPIVITKQINAVNEIYRLHNLSEFYKDPRPHISLAWALGDISHSLQRVVQEELTKHCTNGGSSQKRIFTSKFSGIECRIGNKTYKICKFSEE